MTEKCFKALTEVTDVMIRANPDKNPFWPIRQCVEYMIKDLSFDELCELYKVFHDTYISGQANLCYARNKYEFPKRMMISCTIKNRAKNMDVNDTGKEVSV